MKNTAHLQKVILTIGFFLIAISLYCSFLLYTSFSNQLSDQMAWGGMGLGLDSFKNIALLAAFALWSLNLFAARVLALVVGLAYVLLTILSFTAFFGFMSTVQHKLEGEAVIASAQYRSLKTNVENAERAVQDLSRHADPQAVQEARQHLQQAQGRIDEAKQGLSRWAEPDCTPKRNSRGQPFTSRAVEWCDKLRAIESELAPWQETIDGYQRYQAALAHHERSLAELAALDTGQSSISETTMHPMFIDLGKLLAQAPDEMKVAFMFISSAAAEILGTLSVLIAGFLGHKRSFTLDEIETMSSQLREQQQRLQASLGLLGPSMLPAGFAGAGFEQLPEPPKPAPSSSDNPIVVKPVPRNPPQEESKPAAPPPRLPHEKDEATEAPKGKTDDDDKDDDDDKGGGGNGGNQGGGGGAKPISSEPKRLNQGRSTLRSEKERAEESKLIAEALLQGRCAPTRGALQVYFSMDAPTAEQWLEHFALQGLLINQGGQYYLNLNARKQLNPDLRYGGVAYTRPDARLQEVMFPNPNAALPIRLRAGTVKPVSWGLRSAERNPGQLPKGGWAKIEDVRGGDWDAYAPQPVIIPANGYMQQDQYGQSHWFDLEDGAALQGLLAKSKHGQRLYVVTVDDAPEDLPKHFVPSETGRWPRVIDAGQHTLH